MLLDENGWPINAKASGGGHYRGNYIDQNFDTYSGRVHLRRRRQTLSSGRTMSGAQNEFASFAHGSRGSAVISSNGHAHPLPHRPDQNPTNNADVTWRCMRDEPDPYQLEWNHMMAAIRNNRPYNEVARGAEASLITAMGRMAATLARSSPRPDCSHTPTSSRPWSTPDDGFAGAAPARGRQVPCAQPGILTNREF